GRYLAYVAAGAGAGGRGFMLWIRSLDAAEPQPLQGTTDAAGPFWSPDSRSIGFRSREQLKRVDVRSGSVEVICEASGGNNGASWGPDGSILFSNGTSGIMRVSAAGGAPARVTDVNASGGEVAHTQPWFLPDGRRFLYYSEP